MVVGAESSKQLRECIFHILPKDVVDLASETCLKTLMSGHNAPLEDRIEAMVSAFAEFGVSERQITDAFQKPYRKLNHLDLVRCRGILISLKDQVGQVSDFFEPESELKTDAAKKTAKKKKAVTNNKTEEIAAAISEAPAPAF